ncbi:MAG: Cas10/Cmr2 second palm domain-containing protein [Ktedonobacteraceae bacterium]
MVSESLIAFDTDHIKGYVFGTNRLKEIRGASSILDRLNRDKTVEMAKGFGARRIYAHGGSALFIVDSDKAEALGKAVQKLYHEETGGGASITYAIQPVPDYGTQNIMTAEKLNGNITMADVLKLLRIRLRLAKDSLQMDTSSEDGLQQNDVLTHIPLPSHALLCTCESCGVAYAQATWKDSDDPEDEEGRYCRVCIGKRQEDRDVKNELRDTRKTSWSDQTLWGRILQSLGESYLSPPSPLPQRPKDFNVFREFTRGKEYLGLIYADANSMGKALEKLETLQEVKEFAERIDNAVFEAMGHAIRTHLPLQGDTFPFDILLVGGDDIVMVTPADKAIQVAYTLAEQFHQFSGEFTLSIGVVLAPVKYPFSLQHELVEETLKAAKKSGAQQSRPTSSNDRQEQSRVNFLVVTGNTSLRYEKQYEELHRKSTAHNNNEFYATLRPYTLSDLRWLLDQLKKGNEKRLGRTKLHQLREAILKLNQTTTILESLALLRNWKQNERDFVKQMAETFDTRPTSRQQQMGTLFPWSLDGKESSDGLTIYRTPLLDFIELYDFVTS